MGSKHANNINKASKARKSTPANNNQPPTKNKKWNWIVLLIAIPLLVYLILVISFSGGISAVVSNLKPAPNPESYSVTTKRNNARQSLEVSFAELAGKVRFAEYATSSHDLCYEGQNNWKVKSGYAHSCDYRLTKYYGFNGDFRQEMLDFDQKITSLSWLPAGRNTQRYKKDGVLLAFEYAEKDTKNLFAVEYAQQAFEGTIAKLYEKKELQDVNAIFQEITKENKFLFVVSMQENYFQN